MSLSRSTGSPAAPPIRTLHRVLFTLLLTRGQFTLNLCGAADGGRGRDEGSHDPISGVLDLATLRRSQSIPHYRVVDAEKFHRGVVPVALRQRRRSDDVREQDSPDTRIARILGASGDESRPGCIHLAATEKTIGEIGLYFDEFLGRKAMSFRVNFDRRLRTWCIHEAETLPATLSRVRLRHVFRGRPVKL